MSQWVAATKPKDLTSISGTHIVEGKTDSHELSPDLQICTTTHVHHAINKSTIKV